MRFPLHIQLFAEETGENPPSNPDQGQASAPTLAELLEGNPALRSEYEEAIRVERMQAEAIRDAAHQQTLSQQERLARLNEDERAAEELRIREETIANKERAIELRELRASAAEMLREKNLPGNLLDLVVFTDANSVKASIEVLKSTFDAEVSAKTQSIAQGTPTPRTGKAGSSAADAPKAAIDKKVDELAKRFRVDDVMKKKEA